MPAAPPLAMTTKYTRQAGRQACFSLFCFIRHVAFMSFLCSSVLELGAELHQHPSYDIGFGPQLAQSEVHVDWPLWIRTMPGQGGSVPDIPHVFPVCQHAATVRTNGK
jgi:hypothetical protein